MAIVDQTADLCPEMTMDNLYDPELQKLSGDEYDSNEHALVGSVSGIEWATFGIWYFLEMVKLPTAALLNNSSPFDCLLFDNRLIRGLVWIKFDEIEYAFLIYIFIVLKSFFAFKFDPYAERSQDYLPAAVILRKHSQFYPNLSTTQIQAIFISLDSMST